MAVAEEKRAGIELYVLSQIVRGTCLELIIVRSFSSGFGKWSYELVMESGIEVPKVMFLAIQELGNNLLQVIAKLVS